MQLGPQLQYLALRLNQLRGLFLGLVGGHCLHPLIKAMARNTESGRDLRNGIAAIDDLSHGLFLEFRGIALGSHGLLSYAQIIGEHCSRNQGKSNSTLCRPSLRVKADTERLAVRCEGPDRLFRSANLVGLVRQGHRDREGGAASHLTLYPDPSPVQLNELPRDREAEPGTLHFLRSRPYLAELLKHRLLILGC